MSCKRNIQKPNFLKEKINPEPSTENSEDLWNMNIFDKEEASLPPSSREDFENFLESIDSKSPTENENELSDQEAFNKELMEAVRSDLELHKQIKQIEEIKSRLHPVEQFISDFFQEKNLRNNLENYKNNFEKYNTSLGKLMNQVKKVFKETDWITMCDEFVENNKNFKKKKHQDVYVKLFQFILENITAEKFSMDSQKLCDLFEKNKLFEEIYIKTPAIKNKQIANEEENCTEEGMEYNKKITPVINSLQTTIEANRKQLENQYLIIQKSLKYQEQITKQEDNDINYSLMVYSEEPFERYNYNLKIERLGKATVSEYINLIRLEKNPFAPFMTENDLYIQITSKIDKILHTFLTKNNLINDIDKKFMDKITVFLFEIIKQDKECKNESGLTKALNEIFTNKNHQKIIVNFLSPNRAKKKKFTIFGKKDLGTEINFSSSAKIDLSTLNSEEDIKNMLPSID